MKNVTQYLFYFILVAAFVSCSNKKRQAFNAVTVRLPMDPVSLNPLNAENIYSIQVASQLFQTLLATDLADGKLKPVLAESLPLVQRFDSTTHLTYTLRKEAKWDNGTSITARDVAFTVKLIKCPGLNNDALIADFDIVRDVIYRTDSLQKFTLVYKGYVPEMVFLSGDFPILPAHLFDSANALAPITVPMLVNRRDSVAKLAQIREYARFFNTADINRSPKYLTGSGGYTLERWNTGQRVTLKKKKNWWAETMNASHITAKPDRIDYVIVPDNHAALLMLKSQQLDVLDNISVKDFSRYRKSSPLDTKYHWFSPPTYTFLYLGINSRLSKFSDKVTRQAIAHMLNVPAVINALTAGLALPTIGPISSTSPFYNKDIQPYEYNLEKAKKLLLKAQWKQNKDGNWVRGDEKLSIHLQYKAGNTEYENIALIFQQEGVRMGIPVEVQPVEGQKMAENLDNHEFELFIRSMSGNPFIFNFTPIYHTGPAGSNNFTDFGTVESDSIIEKINVANTEAEKTILLKRLQEILHEESTIVFMYTTNNRMAISSRFSNAKISAIRPNYDVSSLTLVE